MDRNEFTSEEWSVVASIVGNLHGVDVAVGPEGGFQFLSSVDADVIEQSRQWIVPATHDHVKSHLEGRLLAVRAWMEAKEVVGKLGQDYHGVARAARKLLEALPPLDPDLPNIVNSPELRAQLHALVAYTSNIGTEVDGMLRRPNHRPKMPQFKIDYWSHLMVFWTQTLGRSPTNSPHGPLPRFINAASKPAANVLMPSEEAAYEFVKKHRKRVWAEVEVSE